jgi:hypothetical protein
MVRPGSRPDLQARFREVVARGLARAEREHRAHMARLRPRRKQTPAERRRLHAALTDFRRRRDDV